MKNNRVNLMLAAAILLAAAGCHRSTAWNGTWQLNPSRSTIPGPSLSVSITPNGAYQIGSANQMYEFRCDDTASLIPDGYVLFCSQKNASTIEMTKRKGGDIVSATRWELSPDGKTLNSTIADIQIDKSFHTRTKVYTRLSGSTGFAGGWLDPDRFNAQPKLMQLTLSDKNLTYSFPDNGQSANPALDGSDAPFQGPGVPPGATLAVTANGPSEFQTTKKLNGQIINQGLLRLGTDARTVEADFWRPGFPNDKVVLVYDKQ